MLNYGKSFLHLTWCECCKRFYRNCWNLMDFSSSRATDVLLTCIVKHFLFHQSYGNSSQCKKHQVNALLLCWWRFSFLYIALEFHISNRWVYCLHFSLSFPFFLLVRIFSLFGIRNNSQPVYDSYRLEYMLNN